jgi:hypothetical protein
MPEEPSVLDYLKSNLKFWEHGEKIRIPEESGLPWEGSSESSHSGQVRPGVLPVEPDSLAEAKPPRVKPAEPNHWPWRSLLALILFWHNVPGIL